MVRRCWCIINLCFSYLLGNLGIKKQVETHNHASLLLFSFYFSLFLEKYKI